MPASVLRRLPVAFGRRRGPLSAALVLTGMVWLAGGLWQVALAYHEARGAEASLNLARRDLSGSGLTSGAPVGPLGAGAAQLERAAGRINGAWALPWRGLPLVGTQVYAVGSLAAAAGQVACYTEGAVGQVHALLGAHPVGPARVTELERLAAVAGQARARLGTVRVVSPGLLLPPVQRRRRQLLQELGKGTASLRTAQVAAAALAGVLGGPTRYLLLVDNNGEMRAGSGTFLTAGLITGSQGRLTVSSLENTAGLQLPPGRVSLSGDLAARWGWLHPGEEWRNLGTTPDFPVTAALAARMWGLLGRPPVDGVVAVDIPAFRRILAVTGPVTVQGRTFDAGNVAAYLVHDQYARASFNPAEDAGRTRLLKALASAALHQLESGKVSLSRASGQLGPLVTGRHLLVWSPARRTQAAWDLVGVSGRPGPNDLELSIINRGGNKLDQYLRTTAVLSLRPRRRGTDVTVSVEVRNLTPPGQAAFIAGPNPGLPGIPYGVYTGLVALDIPGRAHITAVQGVPSLDAAGPDGPLQVYAAPVSVAPGSVERIVFGFRLPAGLRSLRVDPSARLHPTVWQVVGGTFDDESAHFLTW